MNKYDVQLTISCTLELEGFEAEDEDDVAKKISESDWSVYVHDYNLSIEDVYPNFVDLVEEDLDDEDDDEDGDGSRTIGGKS